DGTISFSCQMGGKIRPKQSPYGSEISRIRIRADQRRAVQILRITQVGGKPEQCRICPVETPHARGIMMLWVRAMRPEKKRGHPQLILAGLGRCRIPLF